MDMYEVFAQNPLLAILRNVPKEITLDYAGAILRGGVKVFEVALNSPDALEQITLLHKTYGSKCLVGAGTAISVSTPSTDRRSARRTRAAGNRRVRAFSTASENECAV